MSISNVIPYRGYNYISAANPAISTNPLVPYAKWLNSTTGEWFVCTDNTVGVNIWVGNQGTTVP